MGRFQLRSALHLAFSIVALLFAAGSLSGRTVEEPAINANLRFEGNNAFTRRRLLASLETDLPILAREVDRPAADDAAFTLERFYRRQGYRESKVDFRIEAGGRLLFLIHEGVPTSITSLTFTGAESIGVAALQRTFRFTVQNLSNTHTRNLPYAPKILEEACKTLVNVYANEGFRDALVTTEVTPIGEGAVSLVVQIVEGIRYRYAADQVVIENKGDPWPMRGDPDKALRSAITEILQQPARPSSPALIQNRIVSLLQNEGCYSAFLTILETPDLSTGIVALRIVVNPGPRYRVAEVHFEGQQKTRLRTLERFLDVPLDRFYDAGRVDRGVRRLLFSGAFRDVDATTTTLENNRLALNLGVDEGPSRSLSFLGGYGSYEGPRTNIRYVDRNLWGTLRRFQADAFASGKAYGSELTLSDASLTTMESLATAQLFISDREEPSYRISDVGARLGMEWKWSPRFVTTAQYLLQRSFDGSSPADIGYPSPNQYTLSSIAVGQRMDFRDSSIRPTRGLHVEGRLEFSDTALGGDLDFLRGTGRASYFVPLLQVSSRRPNIPVLILSGQLGIIQPLNGSAIPIQERFFTGGGSSVRSFKQNTLGPKDSDGNAIGGLSFGVLTVELQQPIWRGLHLALFCDAGVISQSPRIPDFGYSKKGVGAGFRYFTPIGAVTLDYGINPDPEDFDEPSAVHFSIGFQF